MSFFLFLVSCNYDLFTPVLIVNIKVKEAPAIPAGIPTTVACEATLNKYDKVVNLIK